MFLIFKLIFIAMNLINNIFIIKKKNKPNLKIKKITHN